MKIYRGTRSAGGCAVTVDGKSLDPRFDIEAAPLAAFEWGYDGAGPSRLALAILVDYFGDAGRAVPHVKRFRAHVIAQIESAEWTISGGDIDTFLECVVDVPMTLAELLEKARRPR